MGMTQSGLDPENKISGPEPPALWKSLIILVLLVVVAVGLFGALIYLFIRGAQQLGWPSWVQVVIFVGVSGIFAWLLKRISDTVSEMGRRWFPEDHNDA